MECIRLRLHAIPPTIIENRIHYFCNVTVSFVVLLALLLKLASLSLERCALGASLP